MPPGDKYVLDKSNVPTQLLPSDIQRCKNCGHIQMSSFTSDPNYVYETYLSRPASTNPVLAKLYSEYCEELKELADGGSILEVGSNDGLFLELFKNLGVKAIGIDPAKNLVEIANSRGVNTINDYVSSSSVSDAVRQNNGLFNLVLANHSFSNVENIQEWASLLTECLAEDGYLVLQSFYQLKVLKEKLIENYNHEHLSYLLIDSCTKFFSQYGLVLEKVRSIDAKGGSIRFYFKKTTDALPLDAESVNLIESEASQVKDIDLLFKETESYILERRAQFSNILSKYKKIAAYGTSIGATVFSYQFDLQKHITTFFDDDILRQNRFSPGTGCSVLPGRSAEMEKYDACIILAPLYADPIIANNSLYLKNGGTFIKFWPNIEEVK